MENLLQQADRLAPVTPESLADYLRHRDDMLEQVNATLLGRADLSVLLGGNPPQVMFDNHRYHFDFMANVFEFQGYDMLVRMVPWVYRAYINHGFKADYFVVELEAWMASVQKFMAEEGGAIIDTYAFMLENHDTFLALALKGTGDEASCDENEHEPFDRFYRYLLAGDFKECFVLGRDFLEQSPSLEGLYLNIIQPAMYRVGREWEAGKISVAKEHLASAIVMRLLASIYPLLDPPASDKGSVLVTSAPNEFHEIGAWMVANTLELDGWKTLYLGANTPASDLLSLVDTEQPKILALSIAMPFNLHHVKVIIDRVKKLPVEKRPRTLVGGHVFRLSERLYGALGADGYAINCAMAKEIAHAWLEGSIQ